MALGDRNDFPIVLLAFAETTASKVNVITRKAYGEAFGVMRSKNIRGDMNYAWPTAEIAVMGPKQAVEIIFRADIGDAEALKAREADYKSPFANPFVAASRGYIDDVSMRHGMRLRLILGRCTIIFRSKKLYSRWLRLRRLRLVISPFRSYCRYPS